MDKIIFNPIGVIHTPYTDRKNMPIQGRFGNDSVIGSCTVLETFADGLKDLDGFSHAILLYYFHESVDTKILDKPFLEPVTHGIFAIRSPNRPNKIGLSIVKIVQIRENRLYFTDVDMLDKTPLLDIKPYVEYFDSRDNVKSGWVDKHFTDGNIPDATILK